MFNEKVSEPEAGDLGGCDRRSRNISRRFLIVWMDARRHRRTDGYRASSDGGCWRAGTDLRRTLPASGGCSDKIDRVQKGVVVMGPALDHREGRLGDNARNRWSKLGGSYGLRRTAGQLSLGAALCRCCRAPLLRGRSDLGPGVIMGLSARFSLLHSDLNDFLFAPVGEEENGITLSVVSGLTRLGLDPWEEAARLTPLPKARAAEVLATLIARLPIDRTRALDDLAISRRLVELLPAQKMVPLQGREQAGAGQKKYWEAMILLAGVALGAALVYSML